MNFKQIATIITLALIAAPQTTQAFPTKTQFGAYTAITGSAVTLASIWTMYAKECQVKKEAPQAKEFFKSVGTFFKNVHNPKMIKQMLTKHPALVTMLLGTEAVFGAAVIGKTVNSIEAHMLAITADKVRRITRAIAEIKRKEAAQRIADAKETENTSKAEKMRAAVQRIANEKLKIERDEAAIKIQNAEKTKQAKLEVAQKKITMPLVRDEANNRREISQQEIDATSIALLNQEAFETFTDLNNLDTAIREKIKLTTKPNLKYTDIALATECDLTYSKFSNSLTRNKEKSKMITNNNTGNLTTLPDLKDKPEDKQTEEKRIVDRQEDAPLNADEETLISLLAPELNLLNPPLNADEKKLLSLLEMN